eukprot:2965044-Rhodomonas_salina.1
MGGTDRGYAATVGRGGSRSTTPDAGTAPTLSPTLSPTPYLPAPSLPDPLYVHLVSCDLSSDPISRPDRVCRA